VHLADDGAAKIIDVDEEFWSQIAHRTDLHQGRLLSASRMTGSPGHWEMHPRGDEILILLPGSVDVILETTLPVRRVMGPAVRRVMGPGKRIEQRG